MPPEESPSTDRLAVIDPRAGTFTPLCQGAQSLAGIPGCRQDQGNTSFPAVVSVGAQWMLALSAVRSGAQLIHYDDGPDGFTETFATPSQLRSFGPQVRAYLRDPTTIGLNLDHSSVGINDRWGFTAAYVHQTKRAFGALSLRDIHDKHAAQLRVPLGPYALTINTGAAGACLSAGRTLVTWNHRTRVVWQRTVSAPLGGLAAVECTANSVMFANQPAGRTNEDPAPPAYPGTAFKTFALPAKGAPAGWRKVGRLLPGHAITITPAGSRTQHNSIGIEPHG